MSVPFDQLPVVPMGRPPGEPLLLTEAVQCKYLSADKIRVHGSNRDWRLCDHPTQPLGPLVCGCRGCGPNCTGYVEGQSCEEN